MNGLTPASLVVMSKAQLLPQDLRMSIIFAASQFPNMMGAVLLITTIDKRIAVEAEKESAESARDTAQREIAEAIAKLNQAVGLPTATTPAATTLADAVANAVKAITDAETKLKAALIS